MSSNNSTRIPDLPQSTLSKNRAKKKSLTQFSPHSQKGLMESGSTVPSTSSQIDPLSPSVRKKAPDPRLEGLQDKLLATQTCEDSEDTSKNDEFGDETFEDYDIDNLKDPNDYEDDDEAKLKGFVNDVNDKFQQTVNNAVDKFGNVVANLLIGNQQQYLFDITD